MSKNELFERPLISTANINYLVDYTSGKILSNK